MQIQTLSLTFKTSHFNTLFSNCFSSFKKKMNFDVECTVFHFWNSFFVCVCMRRWIIMAQSSPKMRQNTLFRVSNLKIFLGKAPCTPYGRGASPSHAPPTAPAVRGRCWSALLHCSDGYSISFSSYFKIWGEPWARQQKHYRHHLKRSRFLAIEVRRGMNAIRLQVRIQR